MNIRCDHPFHLYHPPAAQYIFPESYLKLYQCFRFNLHSAFGLAAQIAMKKYFPTLKQSYYHYVLVIHNYRCTNRYVFIDFFCICLRCVDTAVRSVSLINISTKGTSPVCIVNADISIKWHPVIYMGIVSFSHQIIIGHLRINRPYTVGWSCTAFDVDISGYNRRIYDALSIHIAPHSLVGNRYFDISASNIVGIPTFALITVFRLYRSGFSGFDLLDQGIRRFLKPEYRDLDLTVLPTAPSTNALVREKANQGRPEGCIIIACEQTDGRGRYGRQFFSPVDSGVYLSLLLRPTAYSPQQATCLTAAAAAAMCQAIEAVTGQQPGIKWVNDIFLHGKKVCGILTEAAVGLETGTLNYMVLGAGVNLYPPAEGFPEEIQSIAGSVLERSCPEAKNRLVGEFLNRFWDFYSHPECRAYLEDYRARSLAIGRNVTVLSAGKAVSAYAYGIDDDFRLLVRYENGDTEALSYGEIRIQLDESAP